MRLTVDRLEGECVVCEECDSGEMVSLDRKLFPEEIRSGDLVECVVTVLPNSEAENRIKEKMDRLWK